MYIVCTYAHRPFPTIKKSCWKTAWKNWYCTDLKLWFYQKRFRYIIIWGQWHCSTDICIMCSYKTKVKFWTFRRTVCYKARNSCDIPKFRFSCIDIRVYVLCHTEFVYRTDISELTRSLDSSDIYISCEYEY